MVCLGIFFQNNPSFVRAQTCDPNDPCCDPWRPAACHCCQPDDYTIACVISMNCGSNPTPCLAGVCSKPGNNSEAECQNAGGSWYYTCCDYNNIYTSTYNPNKGYCSSVCNGTCTFWDNNISNWNYNGHCNVDVQGCYPTCTATSGPGTAYVNKSTAPNNYSASPQNGGTSYGIYKLAPSSDPKLGTSWSTICGPGGCPAPGTFSSTGTWTATCNTSRLMDRYGVSTTYACSGNPACESDPAWCSSIGGSPGYKWCGPGSRMPVNVYNIPTCSISCSPNPGTQPNAIDITTNANGNGGGIYGVNVYVNRDPNGGYSTWDSIASANGGGASTYSTTNSWSSTNTATSYTVGTHRVAANLYDTSGNYLYQCGNTCTLNPPPPPSCTLDLLPATNTIYTNGTVNLTASYTANNAIISYVDFSSNTNTAATTVNPSRDSYAPYITRVTAGNTAGTAIITAVGTMSDGNTTCRDTATVNVIYPPPTCGTLACAFNPNVLKIGDSGSGQISGAPTNGTITGGTWLNPPSTTTLPVTQLASLSAPGLAPTYRVAVTPKAVGTGQSTVNVNVLGLDGTNIICARTCQLTISSPDVSCQFNVDVSGATGPGGSIIVDDSLTVTTTVSVPTGALYAAPTTAEINFASSVPAVIRAPADVTMYNAPSSTNIQILSADHTGSTTITASGYLTNFQPGLGITSITCTPGLYNAVVNEYGGWWQTGAANAYGDIFAKGTIRSPLPNDTTFLDLGNNPLTHSTIVSTDVGITGHPETPSIDLWSHEGKLSTAQYQVKTDSTSPAGETGKYASYTYWHDLLTGQLHTFTWPGGHVIDSIHSIPSIISGMAANETRVYEVDGDLTVSSIQQVNNAGGSPKAVIFLVKGDLLVNAIITSRDPQLFLGFIVKGGGAVDGIKVQDGLQRGINTTMDGFFLTDGTFDTGTNVGGNQDFSGKGVFIAHDFKLQRTMGNQNKIFPSETFIFDPALILNAPAEMMHPLYSWSEMVP